MEGNTQEVLAAQGAKKVGEVMIMPPANTMSRVESLRIGDPVKVLQKPASYSTDMKVYYGVVVAFELFKKLPTLVILYAESGYASCDLKTLYYNEKVASKEDAPEIIRCPPSDIQRASVATDFRRSIQVEREKLQAQMRELDFKEKYFVEYFGSLVGEGNLIDRGNEQD